MRALEHDNWRDQSTFVCKTCRFFVGKGYVNLFKPELDKSLKVVLGRCRCHAPTMKGFPVVFETDWCGEHKLDHVKMRED